MTQVEMVPLGKIKDNPWRDRVRNPIDTERVEAIATSIEKTKKYWTGTYGRKVAGGFVELAFGHHRYEAAKAQGLKTIPIILEEFTDGEMLVWMAQENVRGELPVVLEAVSAAVKALGDRKIEIEAPDPKTRKDALRYAPSFICGKPSCPTVGHPYTTDTLARYLGYIKASTDRARNSVVAALGILEQAEIAAAEGGDTGKRKAVALERSFSAMKVNDAAKAVSDIKRREAQVAARTVEAKKEAEALDKEQRRIQQEQKEAERKAQEKREALVKQIAAAKAAENEKKATELRDKLAKQKAAEADQEVLLKIRQAALDAKVEETKKKEAEQRKEDAYLPIRREVVRILHKLEGETATTKEGLAEEVKALARKELTMFDRSRLNEAAHKMAEWYDSWVAEQFLPPLSTQKKLAAYQSREEANRRSEEAKAAKLADKKGEVQVKIDNNVAHDSRVQRDDVVGNFCDVPIVTLDELGMDADVLSDLDFRLRLSSGTSVAPEVLPGEEICADRIIRRSTTAEAVGYDVYHNQEAIEAGAQRGSINVGRLASLAGKLVHWRPNRDTNPHTEFVLIHTEEAA